MAVFEIKSYDITITNNSGLVVYIWLYDDDSWRTSQFRAVLVFQKLPEGNVPVLTESGNRIESLMPWETFNDVVDLIRNEKPTIFAWNTGAKICSVSSADPDHHE